MMASAEQSYLQAVERAVDLLMLLASAS